MAEDSRTSDNNPRLLGIPGGKAAVEHLSERVLETGREDSSTGVYSRHLQSHWWTVLVCVWWKPVGRASVKRQTLRGHGMRWRQNFVWPENSCRSTEFLHTRPYRAGRASCVGY